MYKYRFSICICSLLDSHLVFSQLYILTTKKLYSCDTDLIWSLSSHFLRPYLNSQTLALNERANWNKFEPILPNLKKIEIWRKKKSRPISTAPNCLYITDVELSLITLIDPHYKADALVQPIYPVMKALLGTVTWSMIPCISTSSSMFSCKK